MREIDVYGWISTDNTIGDGGGGCIEGVPCGVEGWNGLQSPGSGG